MVHYRATLTTECGYRLEHSLLIGDTVDDVTTSKQV